MPYNPDLDPLIRRARARSPKGHTIWALIAVLLVGLWFMDRRGKVFGISRDSGQQTIATDPQLISRDASGVAYTEGPFKISWIPGQLFYGGMSADLTSKGNAALESSTGLNMHFDTDYYVQARNNDSDDNFQLVFNFGDVNMNGNFFGYPVDLRRRDGIIQSYVDESIMPVETAMNKMFAPLEGLDFNKPIYTTLSPKGVVKDVQQEGGRFSATARRIRR